MPSINNSLNTAVTGLDTSSDGMSIISNNIANANTKGFKTDRPEFEDQLAISLSDTAQLGRGPRLKTVTTLHNQGAVINTGQLTDLAIQGDGFFAVKSELPGSRESANGLVFTRQGSFRFDKDGRLTDPLGYRVQGYMPEPDMPTKLKPGLSDIQINTNSIPPKETNIVNIVANLDVREKALPDPFNPAKAAETSNFATAVTIYDNFGYGRQAQVYFNRLPGATNSWEWHAMVDGNEASLKPEKDEKGRPLPVEIAQGKIEFDPQGNPILPFTTKNGVQLQYDSVNKSDAFTVHFQNGSKPQKIQFNFGPAILEDGKVGSQGSTSIAARSGMIFHSQDGYETGYLKTLRIEQDGAIRGVFSNGLERRLANVALASFANNNGLQKIGRNNYAFSPKAGEPRFGTPQTASRGSIFSASLEESNVDLAQQFVNMIVTQRAFQANSKSITTSDTMLEEVINLKR